MSDDHVNSNPAREKSQFPEGLRVLAVDDNLVCLKVIAAQLMKCRYIVTVTTKATEALQMLRKNKESYDIVITDVEMPDMDGFQLLEIIGLEMDMPVIMMSASGDTKTVMKGIKHGARDYLIKPVRLTEVKNIWQHVVRKNLALDPTKLGTKKEEKEQNPLLSKTKRQKERCKDKEEQTNAPCDEGTSGHKKPRLVWSKELHNKFVDVVQQLGIEKAVPKKILEKMNDQRLTRENVASHLQKFRNLLKKESEKAKMNQESEIITDFSKTIMPLSNPTLVPSGIASFGTQYKSFDAFPANNRRPLFYSPNQHEILLRQNIVPQQVADQTCSTVPIPAPIFMQNSSSLTQLDWMSCQSNLSRTNMVDGFNHADTYHFPSLNSGQFGPTTMPIVPYSCPPSDAFNRGDVAFQDSTLLNCIHQPDSLVHSSSYGQYEGRNLINCHGIGETTGLFVQHPFENMESNYNFPDDDLSDIIRQFNNNAPPGL